MKIGDPYTFVPAAFSAGYDDDGRIKRQKVTGKIIGANRGHRWVRVAYTVNGNTLYECFKY